MWTLFVGCSLKVKPHWVKSEWIDYLHWDLAMRHCEVLDPEKSREEKIARFEGGSVMPLFLNQPWMSFELLDGRVLEIDCHSLEYFFERLKKAKRRQFEQGPQYYKMINRFNCLVLSIEDRESLLFQISSKIKEANRLADEFFGVKSGEHE